MLKSVFIRSLYGLYTYQIDFAPSDGRVRFITASNGYGKTTLLRILNSLYTLDFVTLANIHFDNVTIDYDDGYRICVNQIRHYSTDVEQDDALPENIELQLTAWIRGGEQQVDDIVWESAVNRPLGITNLTGYLQSHPIYYVKDTRMQDNGEGRSRGSENAMKMASFLSQLGNKITVGLQRGLMNRQEPISEDEYNRQMAELQPVIDRLIQYHLIEVSPIPPFRKDVAESILCHTAIEALKSSIAGAIMHQIELVDTFWDVINNYDYVHKKLELSPEYGYRFKAEDEEHSLLFFDDLSSGERHILLINYDLLFGADDDSLILIDEPEMSFHLEWQDQFMYNMDSILRVRDLQCVVCTHAPEIFNYEWNRSVDLVEQARKYEEGA